MASLKDTFAAFASFGGKDPNHMDSAAFAKLGREAGLLQKGRLASSDLDVIFAQCRAPETRKLDFAGFQRALAKVAEELQTSTDDVEQRVTKAAPQVKATQAEDNAVVQRLTDTKNYTGAHKLRFDEEGRGLGLAGRDSIPKGSAAGSDLSAIVDRSPADVRGVKVGADRRVSSSSGSSQSAAEQPQAGGSPTKARAGSPSKEKRLSTTRPDDEDQGPRDLHEVFADYAAFGRSSAGAAELDSANFVKCFRDSGLVGKNGVSTTDLDIIFAQCKRPGGRRLSYASFETAVDKVAGKLGCSADEVKQRIEQARPSLSGNVTVQEDDIVQRLTDTKLYTGTHKERFDSEGHGLGLAGRDSGGVDGSKVTDLSQVTDRSEADVRGRKRV